METPLSALPEAVVAAAHMIAIPEGTDVEADLLTLVLVVLHQCVIARTLSNLDG